jgi:hypothetical protein
MTTKKRFKEKGRKQSGPFVKLPHEVQDSANWKLCGGTAIKLLCAMARQYNGKNNGDLGASIKVMAALGWRSSDTLDRSLKELLHYGFITLTRQGGRNSANLYAITWQSIDECGGKLDCRATIVASHEYKQPKALFKRSPKNTPSSSESGATRFGIRSSDVSKAA